MGAIQKKADSTTDLSVKAEQALIDGNLRSMSPEDRLHYYKNVCSSLGLNPLTKPFGYIELQGKLTLYALKGATDQLRTVHGISVQITRRETIGDLYIVSALAKSADGRADEDDGAVVISGLKGEALANAMMKAVTKAKRRVTLSLCGLGMLDETEAPKNARVFSPDDDIPHAAITARASAAGKMVAPPAQSADDQPDVDATTDAEFAADDSEFAEDEQKRTLSENIKRVFSEQLQNISDAGDLEEFAAEFSSALLEFGEGDKNATGHSSHYLDARKVIGTGYSAIERKLGKANKTKRAPEAAP
jgi:hypothetical protein